MNEDSLIDTAKKLVADDKGLLAMDESNPTCDKRFAKLGIPQTEAARRGYRELIVTTPDLGDSISGAILYDETIRQRKKDGALFIQVLIDAGIIPGINVDTGTKDLAGHPMTDPGRSSLVGCDRIDLESLRSPYCWVGKVSPGHHAGGLKLHALAKNRRRPRRRSTTKPEVHVGTHIFAEETHGSVTQRRMNTTSVEANCRIGSI